MKEAVKPSDARICSECENLVTTDMTCPLCNRPTTEHPFRDEAEGYCMHCAEGPFPTESMHLVTWHEDPYFQDDDGDLNLMCEKCQQEQEDESL